MLTTAARSSLSCVEKRVARSQVNFAAKLVRRFSQVRRDTSNFVNRAVRSAANPDDLENRSAWKLHIMLPDK